MRLATHADIPRMVAMLSRCFNEMDFEGRGYSYELESTTETLSRVINGLGILIVNDDVTAIFGAFIVPSIMNYADMKMVEFIFHTDPLLDSYKRAKYSKQLLEAAENETKKYGIHRLSISAAIEPKNASTFLHKHGYVLHEMNFSKEL